MLLNPKAVQRLKLVTRARGYYYDTYQTHSQRNEWTYMFLEEARKLLDQQAEQTIKHTVELYCAGEISYERYSELIEQISKEEEERGALQGGAYARNHVFDFAQKAVDREKERRHALALTEAQKKLEIERQKADQTLKTTIDQGLAEIAAINRQYTQQYDEETGKRVQVWQEVVAQKVTELRSLAQKQEEQLHQLVAQTRTEMGEAIDRRWEEETRKMEQQMYEKETLRPAREAARAAIDRVTLQEQRVQRYHRLRGGLIGLWVVLLLALVVTLFSSVPLWISILVIVLIALIFLTIVIWKSPILEQALLYNRKEVERFQTQSDDYTALREEDRCTLLVQRMM